MFPSAYRANESSVFVDRARATQLSSFVPTVNLTTSYQTILNIGGKGYLDTTIFTGQANAITVRITVDGVVKFEGTSNVLNNVVGVIPRSLMTNIGNNVYLAIQLPSALANYSGLVTVGGAVGFPYTTNAALGSTLSIMADSIYFGTSLLIEAKAAAAQTTSYYYAGGTI